MSQRVVLVIILSILILLPASQPVTAQQQDVVSVTNGIFEVFVQAANGDIGSYTIRTGDNHPATIAEGDNLEVFYGYTHPGSSFNTIRSYSTQTDYVMDQWPTSEEYTVIYLNPYSVGTTINGTDEIQTVWNLPGPPFTPDKLEIVQKIKVHGTSFSDTRITINILVTNLGANPADLGIRYLWDFQIYGDDGPTFSIDPEGTALTTETEFQFPGFSSYTTQDNDGNNPPTFSVHGTASGCGGVSPDVIQFADWSRAASQAFDYTVDPTRNIANNGGDSAVTYLFGSDATKAHVADAQQTLSFSASVFADAPTSNFGITLSPAAQAVQGVLAQANPKQQAYCGNHYDDENGLIVLPPGKAAFERFRNLAPQALYEIDFTTMIWDENGLSSGESPGMIFLQGLEALSLLIQNNPGDYPPEGVRVRILLGLNVYELENDSWPDALQDQRVRVLEDLQELGLLDDPNLNIEVAVYRNGIDGFNLGTHSHVKMMVVDGKTVVVGGYNMQYEYLDHPQRDMGIQVSGPIAYRGLQIFDELWLGAHRCDQFLAGECTQELTIWGPIEHDQSILTPIAMGDDVVFSLFRDDEDKIADEAFEAAINAANNSINIMQPRFMYYDWWGVLPYGQALLNVLKEETQVQVRILVDGGMDISDSGSLFNYMINSNGICSLTNALFDYAPLNLHYLEARFSKHSLHTKALSIDNSFVIVGSQNFDHSAFGDILLPELYNFDLAEYNLAIDSASGTNSAASEFDSYFFDEWTSTNTNPIVCSNYYDTIQSEIDQAVEGSIIFVPAGIYTESITIDKPLILVGAGTNQTIVQPEGNQPAFRITSSDVVISNLKISGGDGYGIELIDSSPSSLEDIQISWVVFENNAQGGVLVQGLISGSPISYTIENNTFTGGVEGVMINIVDTQTETSIIRGNIFSGQSIAPIHILSADDSRVEYSYNLFDKCGAGTCSSNWHLGNISTSSSEHDNLFDLDPLFASTENGAYQLSLGSPAIDTGNPELVHDLLYDGDGDAKIRIDIGAFEYVPVENNFPVVDAGDDQTADLGNSITINANFTDVDNTGGYSARINWGDGVIEDTQVFITGPGTGEVGSEHEFANHGDYTVEVCVIDLYGGVGCDTTVISLLPVQISCTPSNLYSSSQSGESKLASLSAANVTNFQRLPLAFVPNQGQEDATVHFHVQGLGGKLFFTPTEVVFSLPNPVKVQEDEKVKITYDLHLANVVRLHYQGTNEEPEVEPIGKLPGVVNVLKGNDPSRWRINLPTYSGIDYQELYPGVDLQYEGTDGKLKSTFHVAPGADPSVIVWKYKGADGLSTDESGNLIVNLPEPAGEGAVLVEQVPIAWQDVNGQRVMVAVQYVLDDNDKKVGFQFPNGYDTSIPLVIDPTFSYSTYLGGGKDDEANSLTLDADCNVYLTGSTYSSDFPTVDSIQTNPPGRDVFVTKLNPAGDTLLYSTYLGGDENDSAWGIVLDSQGRITITGETESSDYPTINAYDDSYGGGNCGGPCDDVFVTQLTSDGTGLRYSTYLGDRNDDSAIALAIGSDDQIHITGSTNSSSFPTVNAFDSSFGGGNCGGGEKCKDAFVARIDPSMSGSASLLYSTFLGGADHDKAEALALDATGYVYVTGYTNSNDFSVYNAYQSTRAGDADVFVAKFDTSLSGTASRLYSTYFGGDEADVGTGIALGGTDQVYLTGYTDSLDFPLDNPYDNVIDGDCGGDPCLDAFVTHLDIGSNNLLYSTYLGGQAEERGAGITVDNQGNAYLTGYTQSTDFPVLNAIQPVKGADSCTEPPCADAFVTQLSVSGNTLVYSTYLGGDGEDYGNAILLDGLGNTYVTGYTFSSDFPATPGSFPYVGGSGYSDAFVVKIED